MGELPLFRRILLATALVLLAAPCATGEKRKPTQAYIHGTVFSEGLPIRGAEIWILSADQTSNELHIIEEVKTDKYGIYGTMPLSQGRYLVDAALPKTLDKTRSRSIERVVTISDPNAVALDYDFSIRWREANNLTKEFFASVKTLLASAREEPSMKSIRWVRYGDKSIWLPTFSLPGSDRCTISVLTSLEHNGKDIALPIFNCETEYATHDAADFGYRSLVQLVTQVTGWRVRPNSTATNTIFEIGDMPPYDEVVVEGVNQAGVGFSYTTVKRSPGFRSTVSRVPH